MEQREAARVSSCVVTRAFGASQAAGRRHPPARSVQFTCRPPDGAARPGAPPAPGECCGRWELHWQHPPRRKLACPVFSQVFGQFTPPPAKHLRKVRAANKTSPHNLGQGKKAAHRGKLRRGRIARGAINWARTASWGCGKDGHPSTARRAANKLVLLPAQPFHSGQANNWPYLTPGNNPGRTLQPSTASLSLPSAKQPSAQLCFATKPALLSRRPPRRPPRPSRIQLPHALENKPRQESCAPCSPTRPPPGGGHSAAGSRPHAADAHRSRLQRAPRQRCSWQHCSQSLRCRRVAAELGPPPCQGAALPARPGPGPASELGGRCAVRGGWLRGLGLVDVGAHHSDVIHLSTEARAEREGGRGERFGGVGGRPRGGESLSPGGTSSRCTAGRVPRGSGAMLQLGAWSQRSRWPLPQPSTLATDRPALRPALAHPPAPAPPPAPPSPCLGPGPPAAPCRQSSGSPAAARRRQRG